MDAIQRPPELRTLGEIVGAEWRDDALPELQPGWPVYGSWPEGWRGGQTTGWYRPKTEQDVLAVKRRLSQGADPNDPAESGTDTWGRRKVAPLWLAAELGFDQVVDALLDANADIGWEHPNGGQIGVTALHVAAHADVYSIRSYRNLSKIDTLRSEKVERYARVVRSLATRGGPVAVNARPRGWTPMHGAAAFGQLHAVQVLLEAGANHSTRAGALERARLPTSGPQWKGRQDVVACIEEWEATHRKGPLSFLAVDWFG